IDANARNGGMWNETYDYVRLHQPHPMFTAGDIPWTIGKAPEYLADKREILGHFEHCLKELRTRVDLDEKFGWRYLSHREDEADHPVHIECESVGGDERLTINAKKCIKAVGFRIPEIPPLKFSSQHVHSLSPNGEDLFRGPIAASAAPIYVAGGGKTAMDTAYSLIRAYPSRPVHLFIGKGTLFTNRDSSFPTSWFKRWFLSNTPLEGFLEVAKRFNGENVEEAVSYYRDNLAHCLNDECRQFVFGVISKHENDTIKNGAASITMDYINDVVDSDRGPFVELRSGDTMKVKADSWFVNCTGYINKDQFDYEPYVSDKGNVVSVQPTSAIHFLTTYGGYFLSHLLYLDKIKSTPLYELNFQELTERDKVALPYVSIAHLLHNLGLLVQAVPTQVMLDCHLDFNRWFPMHRRLLAVNKLKKFSRDHPDHLRNTLDTARERFGIRCGPIV
ncbi:MAG: potassium transporter, partial [Pseudomonadota bacterium]